MSAPRPDLAGTLSLQEVRRFLRRSRARPLAVFVAIVYALVSMLEGGMLSIVPIRGGTTVELLTGTGTGQGWWNYPGLLVVAPWGVLALPFFATLAMVVVAAGVGLGMAVAGGLIVRLVRPSPEDVARSKAIGAVTGLTPAMLGLVTLGSCCTTTAAATGGIGLIAQASGTSTSDLLLNNWYLGAAQIVIVWAALVGQELLLTVYGGLLGLGAVADRSVKFTAPPLDRRWALGATWRTLLAVGGILWSLSMLAEWTTQPPAMAGVGWWFRWLVEQQFVAAVAVGAAFYPEGAERLARSLRRGWGRPVRWALGVAAVAVLAWLPPPLPAWGLDSFGSQLVGALGAPAAWGAIPVGPVTGVALVVRWGLEYLVPAGFVLGLVVAPARVLAPLRATVARPASSRPATEGDGARAAEPIADPGRSAPAELRGGASAPADLP